MIIQDDIKIYVSGRLLKTAALTREWLDEVVDPECIVKELKERNIQADIFTFWQLFPDTNPKFPYQMEWDNWAVLPITSYEDWFHNQISSNTRNAVRRALKKGVEVKAVHFSDEFVSGVMKIYNETPFRRGKKVHFYGRSFQDVRAELSKESSRTDFIGAYYQGELIGYMQQIYAKDRAHPFGGLTLIAHRDKYANNALMAKAVELASSRGMRYLIYGKFDYGTGGLGLAEYKVHNGFQKELVPRYYIPLTVFGRTSLKLKMHHGIKGMIPKRLLKVLVENRKKLSAKRNSPKKV